MLFDMAGRINGLDLVVHCDEGASGSEDDATTERVLRLFSVMLFSMAALCGEGASRSEDDGNMERVLRQCSIMFFALAAKMDGLDLAVLCDEGASGSADDLPLLPKPNFPAKGLVGLLTKLQKLSLLTKRVILLLALLGALLVDTIQAKEDSDFAEVHSKVGSRFLP